LLPNSATKFRTVEELVKVTTFGRRFGFLNAACSRRHDRFVALDHVNLGSGFAQLARDYVASDFGSDQQDSPPFHVILQAADYGLGDIFFGNYVDFHAALFDGGFRGGSDGGYPGSLSG
jgi:hypothetical protein